MTNYTQQKLQDVANKVIAQMENAGTDWIKPFSYSSALGSSTGSRNLKSNNLYTGINMVILGFEAMEKGYKSNTWATYKQIQEAGGQVLKGNKSTSVCYYGQHINRIKDDVTGEELINPYRFLKFYNVFNIDQTTLEAKPVVKSKPRTLVERIEDVEKFISYTKAKIVHSEAGRCYYRPATDTINMSPLDSWKAVKDSSREELYYSTLLHELVHWTGTEKRCNRDKASNVFGNEGYAFEELVAEFGSAMLCNTLEISKEPSTQHAKYINNWIARIKEEPKAIFKAIAMSQKAVNFIYDLQQEEGVKKVA